MLFLYVHPFWLSLSRFLQPDLLRRLSFAGVHLYGVHCRFGVVSSIGVLLSGVLEGLTVLLSEGTQGLPIER